MQSSEQQMVNQAHAFLSLHYNGQLDSDIQVKHFYHKFE